MKHSTAIAIAQAQTKYFLENKMITTHDTIGGMSSMNTDSMSAEFEVSGFFDSDNEWNSFAHNKCCKVVVECGLWEEIDDNAITLDSIEGDNVDDGQPLELTEIPVELRSYRCLECNTVYSHAEVRMIGAWYHNYKKYDTVERETPIEYENEDCDPNIHEKAYYQEEITSDDTDECVSEQRIDGSIWNATPAYEPGTRLNARTLSILDDFAFQARIGKGIEFLAKDKNFIALAKDKVDVARLYNIATALKTKGWSKIRLAFCAARNTTEYSDMGITYKQLFPELVPNCPWLPLESSGYYQCNVLAQKYVKPYLAIYRKRNTDPTPTTPAPKGGKVKAIQELMSATGIYTNAMRTFYTNNFSNKKYMVVDFYKALSNAKEGTIIGFKYINGKFEEPRTITFMSNLDVADGNKKGLAICKRMIGTAKALGFITMFRDMDAICMAEFNKEAKRIAVRSLWTNIEKYARLVKDTKFACLV